MLLRLLFVLFLYFEFALNTPLIVYNNAQFDPGNLFSQLTIILPVLSRNSCVCQCYANSLCVTGTFFGYNQTCVLFNAQLEQNQLRLVADNSISVFSFPNKTTIIDPNNLFLTIEWLFDGNLNDVYGHYNGKLVYSNGTLLTNNDTFWMSPGYGEYSSAVNFSNNMYSLVDYYLDLTTVSLTISAWIWFSSNFTSPSSVFDYLVLFSQCQANYDDQCLHTVVANGYLRLGFYGDDLTGNTLLNAKQWYHVAYVYDRFVLQQLVYLNGILDGSRTPNNPYIGNASKIVLGAIPSFNWPSFHSGLIDNLTFVSRVKNASEILDEATLVAYYSFDGSYIDSGPNNINSAISVSTSFDPAGQLNQALLFSSEDISYFQTTGFYYLGQENYAYSFSLWIYSFINYGTILQVSSSNGWCVPMIGFNSGGYLTIQTLSSSGIYSASLTNGTLLLNEWIHISMTYSTTNGIRLFVSGYLVNSNNTFNDYSASGEMSTITIGTCPQPNTCSVEQTKIVASQFQGKIDELKIFSRELSAIEVYQVMTAS